MNRNKYVERIAIIIFIVYAIAFLISGTISNATKYSYEKNSGQIIENVNINQVGDTVTYEFVLDDCKNGSNDILFYTSHQEAFFYEDGELIYSREKVNSVFGHTTGSGWNLVSVTPGTRNIMIRTEAVYPKKVNKIDRFLVGDASLMMMDKAIASLPGLLACLGIMAIGIMVFAYWVLGKDFKGNTSLLYLSITSMTLGVWGAGETEVAQMFITNRVAASFLGFGTLMLVGIFATLFSWRFFNVPNKTVFYFCIGYDIFVSSVAFILQIFQIVDFKQIAPLIQSILPVAIGYWLFCCFSILQDKEQYRKAVINLVGLLVMILSVVLDMISYYTDRSNANQIGKFGFLFYIFVLLEETSYTTGKSITEKHKLEFYKELAVSDVLTGCNNRNSYDEYISSIPNPMGVSIVTFDLNNLKVCNDNLGHAAGDRYLVDSSKYIRNAFEKYGKVFRIGGDEFVVVIPASSHCNFEEACNYLDRQQLVFEDRHPGAGLRISWGYATYDQRLDKNLEKTRVRADEMMYRNKHQYKTNYKMADIYQDTGRSE